MNEEFLGRGSVYLSVSLYYSFQKRLRRKRRLWPIDFSIAFSGFGGGTWGDELVGESRMSSL